ncbi:MAG: hypothetical protein ACREEM_35505, partial [Blastocatellia bacterium]
MIRIFPDSNIYIEALVSPWSTSRAILILARLKLFRLLLSPYVEIEIEEYLLRRLSRDYAEGSRLLDDYHKALTLIDPE